VSKEAIKHFYDKRKYKNYNVNDVRAYNKYCRECNTDYRQRRYGLNEKDIDEMQKYQTGDLDFVVGDDEEDEQEFTDSEEEEAQFTESYDKTDSDDGDKFASPTKSDDSDDNILNIPAYDMFMLEYSPGKRDRVIKQMLEFNIGRPMKK
jgi:hypothetical protein